MLDNIKKAVKSTTGKIVKSQNQKKLWPLSRSSSSLRSDPFEVVTITIAEFDQYWRNKISAISSAESLATVLKLLVVALSVSSGDEVTFETSPASSLTRAFFRSANLKFTRPTIFVQSWTLNSVVTSLNDALRKVSNSDTSDDYQPLFVFPKLNATDRILNELVPVPFKALFLKCNLLELLVGKMLTLKRSEKSGMSNLRYHMSLSSGQDDSKSADFSLGSPPNKQENVTLTNMLSMIFKSCLVEPFSSHLITDAIASCLMTWDDSADLIDSLETLDNLEDQPYQLPPHILLAELVQIHSKSWKVEVLNVILQTLIAERDLDVYRFSLDETALNFVEEIVLDSMATSSPKSPNCEFVRQLSATLETKSIEDNYAERLQKMEQEQARLISAQQSINLSFIVKTVKDLCRELIFQQKQSTGILLNRWEDKLGDACLRYGDDETMLSGIEDKEFNAKLYAKAEARVHQRLESVNEKKRDLAIQRGELKARELKLQKELQEVQAGLAKLFEDEMLCAGEICLELERLDKIHNRSDMFLKEMGDKRKAQVTSLKDLDSMRTLTHSTSKERQFSRLGSGLEFLASEEEEQHISELFNNITEVIAPKMISLEKEMIESFCEAAHKCQTNSETSDEVKGERSQTLDSELFALNMSNAARDAYKPKLRQAAETCERTFDDITDASIVLTRLNIPVQYRTNSFAVKLESPSSAHFDTPHTSASSPSLDAQSPISFPVSKLLSEYKSCKAVLSTHHDLVYDD